MTIERLTTFTKDEISVLELTTTEGETAFGQLSSPGTHDLGGTNDIAVETFHRLIAPWVLGEDPTDLDALIDRLMVKNHKYPGTFVLRALCGLDTAVLDLLGKRRDIGVCELIGGPANPEPVRAYASRPSRETDVEEEVTVCRDYHDEYGIGAFKFKIGKRLGFDTDKDEWPGRTESIVSGVRSGLDEDVDVLVDANGGFSPDRAIEIGTEVLDPNGVIHFEEPCPYWELDWTVRVRDGVDVPVAGGEQDNMFRHWAKQWERIIETPVLDIVQPDVGYVGGLTRAKQITDLAATHGLPAVPHSPNHTLLKVFTLHLLAAIDNPGPYPFEWRDKAWHHSPRTEGLYDPEPTIEDGALAVPEGPGWGVDIGRDWLDGARIDRSEA